MIEGAAVLVVDDQDGSVGPEVRVVADGVVDGRDVLLACTHVVVGMLIASDQFAGAVGCVVVGVVGLDEAVLGKLIVLAGVEEVLECAEERGLVLQQVHNLKRGTGFVVVIEARGVPGGDQALVDAEVLLVPVEDVHANLAERRAPMREGAVAERRPWDRREPSVEHGELGGQPGEAG